MERYGCHGQIKDLLELNEVSLFRSKCMMEFIYLTGLLLAQCGIQRKKYGL